MSATAEQHARPVRGRRAERKVLGDLAGTPAFIRDDWRDKVCFQVPPDPYTLVDMNIVMCREVMRLRAEVDELAASVKALRTHLRAVPAAASS